MTDTLPIPFAGGAMDHAETQRSPEDFQRHINNLSARALLFVNGMPAVGEDGHLVLTHPSELIGRNMMKPGVLFLGLKDDRPYFAATLLSGDNLVEAEAFQQMRSVAGRLPADELAIAGRAKSLLDWHVDHLFCSKCGKESRAELGGITRVCPSCEAQHFPRVNPVAIMMVIHEDHCLLGRSPGWPDGAFSALAGFVSPGETMEETCVREVYEEVGVVVDNVKYIMSQPWPFPSQLMMGLTCRAKSRELTINSAELEDAKWFSKDVVRAVFAGKSKAFLRPPRMAVAHHLIQNWLDE